MYTGRAPGVLEHALFFVAQYYSSIQYFNTKYGTHKLCNFFIQPDKFIVGYLCGFLSCLIIVVLVYCRGGGGGGGGGGILALTSGTGERKEGDDEELLEVDDDDDSVEALILILMGATIRYNNLNNPNQ